MKASNCNRSIQMPRRGGLMPLALLAILLCGSRPANWWRKDEPPLEPNVAPTNYRAKLLDFLQVQLTDATGVREASISEPKLQPVGTESRYVACLRYNAKNG